MSKGGDTRESILETALAMASQIGLEGLSIGALAGAVGMSKSGVYAHFESKEALQLQILETAVERFIHTVIVPALQEPRGEPRIRSFFHRWLAWSESKYLPGGCLFIASANELDDNPGPLRDRLVAAQQDWLGALSTAARIAVEEGHFRSDLDPAQFAYDFYSVILAYHHFSRLLRDPDSRERVTRAFEELIGLSRVGSGAAVTEATAVG